MVSPEIRAKIAATLKGHSVSAETRAKLSAVQKGKPKPHKPGHFYPRLSHGMYKTRTYTSWSDMLQRCLNPKNSRFRDYGGRGITVCERWRRFENFYADMGERPTGTSIDRKDNNGSYELANCRWATPAQQYANTRIVARTHCPQGHSYDEANTGRTKQGHRYCKQCAREGAARYKAQRKA